MATPPSPNGSNGRDNRGRFSKGNPGGPGNPFAASVGRWRAALMASITEKDIAAVVKALVKAAKAGEPWAVRELLDRALGRPVEADLLERLEALEAAAQAKEGERRWH
jgi:hypothetical protein